MSKKAKYQGKWLNFYETSFTNHAGESREWEYAARTGTDGAACIIAIEAGDPPQLILVKQFRPPIDNFVLEFPAGLVDAGESLPHAARRELEEETGYVGKIVQVGPPIYSSPGLTDEFVALVTMEVTGQTESQHEADESIEIVKLPLTDLMEGLRRFYSQGIYIDAKLWSFAQGLSFQESDI